MAQGKCKLPENMSNRSIEGERDEYGENFYNNLNDNEILIMGAGQIQPRKGVDLFVLVASKIIEFSKNKKLKFVWIGEGYKPDEDYNVSIWIKDQIERSGISEHITILDSSEI